MSPPGALDESITAKSGEVIEIACSTDSQPDSCTFTHMHPENMNYNGNSNTQEQVNECIGCPKNTQVQCVNRWMVSRVDDRVNLFTI